MEISKIKKLGNTFLKKKILEKNFILIIIVNLNYILYIGLRPIKTGLDYFIKIIISILKYHNINLEIKSISFVYYLISLY